MPPGTIEKVGAARATAYLRVATAR